MQGSFFSIILTKSLHNCTYKLGIANIFIKYLGKWTELKHATLKLNFKRHVFFNLRPGGTAVVCVGIVGGRVLFVWYGFLTIKNARLLNLIK